MSDLIVEDEEDLGNPVDPDCIDLKSQVDLESEIDEADYRDLDARKRLEKKLDEKRLRDELDDFGGY